jgi:hypothetical protein
MTITVDLRADVAVADAAVSFAVVSASTNRPVLEGKTSQLGVSLGPVDRKKRVRFRIPPAPWASGSYFVTVGLDSPDGRLFHVQTQHYPLTVPDADDIVHPLAVRPTVEVEDL